MFIVISKKQTEGVFMLVKDVGIDIKIREEEVNIGGISLINIVLNLLFL